MTLIYKCCCSEKALGTRRG